MTLIFKTLAISTLAMTAFGASPQMNFHVEFPFRAGKVQMPAGGYSISSDDNNRQILRISNRDVPRQIFLVLPIADELKSGDTKATLGFLCDQGGCKISHVKNLRPGYVFKAWVPKKPNMKTVAVALTSPLTAGE